MGQTLTRLEVRPAQAECSFNEHLPLKAKGYDQYGHEYDPGRVEWSVSASSDCTITQDGHFQSGTTPGLSTVTARCSEFSSSVPVRVKEKGEGPKSIRWTGRVPYQKWTTFYSRVISPFVPKNPDLSPLVELALPCSPDTDEAKAQLEKVRNALRDLGLSDEVTTT